MESQILSIPPQTGVAVTDSTRPTKSSHDLLPNRGKTNLPMQAESSQQDGTSPIPLSDDVEQLSEQVPKMLNVSAGEATEELSDISEFEGTMSRSMKSSYIISTLIRRILPLIRNKKVRLLLIINFFATIINMLLLLILTTFIIWNIVLNVQVRSAAGIKKFPCLFSYLEWSDCSATCRVSENGTYPQRFRKVNKSSIIQARNGGQPECPVNLADQVDSAPCNIYLCPTNLSDYDFSKFCNYNDANRRDAGGCYKIRAVPLDNRLVHIDTNLTENCDCSSDIHL